MNLTPEIAERGYNNRAAVPDYAAYFARWDEESAAVRARLRCEVDVRYGTRAQETMDLLPAGGRRGLLFFIHGGYWRALDKSGHSFVAEPFVEHGFDVAVINYDLCPNVDIATIVAECRNALQWVVQNGRQHGLNVERIVIAGHSAGGHLVAMLHATDWKSRGVDPDVIVGGAGISGVYDLQPLLMTSMNADLRLDEESVKASSPVLLQPLIRAPLLIAAGGGETSEFVRQSRLLWDAWPGVARPKAQGGPMLPEGIHHFSVLDRLADDQDLLFVETVKLFG